MGWDRWTDSKPVTDDELLKRWEGHIQKVAKQCRRYGLDDDIEDIASDIRLRLLTMKQAKRPFTGYVKTVITNTFRSALTATVARGATPTSRWKQWSTASLSSPIVGTDGVTYLDHITIEETPVEDLDLQRMLDKLDERTRRIITWYWLEDYTCAEIGDMLGITGSCVGGIIRRTMKDLRIKTKPQ